MKAEAIRTDTPIPQAAKRHSVSKQMLERFQTHEKRRKCVAILYVAIYLVYLGWRLTILNEHSMGLSLTYFTAECMGLILGLTIITTSWNYTHHEPTAPPANLSVDIFIPTYKEPAELIRRTVMAAKEIDYPHQTWILDDGRREEVRALAREFGIRYLSRPDNTHAKAGNLNYGLAHSTAEFVMVFDADHIALPHALDIMLGFFSDETVAMVQTPQDYYNTTAFQYINSRHGGLWHDQSFFYNIGQSCRDTVNGASCVGTGVVYRRSALDKIDGIPTATVTEDIHTTLKLHKAGYRTIYLNEPVAYGEAAPDLKEYYKTRHRWGHGNLHALQQEDILLCKGLTLRQRIAHLSLGLIYLEGWQQLLIFTIPICSLVFGLQPFEISIFNILVVLLFPFFNYMLLQEIGCGFARFWPNEVYAMARWPVHILSTAGAFGRSMPWHTTLKNIKARIHWHLMAPQITVMLLSLGAIGFAFFKLRQGDFETGPVFRAVRSLVVHGGLPSDISIFSVMPHGYTVDLVAIAGFWALYNAVRAAVFVIKSVRNAQQSHKFFRFSLPLPVLMDKRHYGRVTQISEEWVRFCAFDGNAIAVGDEITISVFLPAGPLDLRVSVEKLHKVSSEKTAVIEGNLVWSSPELRDQLARSLYSVDWHREFLNRQGYFQTPLDLLAACLTFRIPARSRYGNWQPILYHDDHNHSPVYGIIAADRYSPGMASVIVFTPLESNHLYQGWKMADESAVSVHFRVIEEQLVSSLVQKGLDRAVVHRYQVQADLVTKAQHSLETLALPVADEAIQIAL